MKLKNRQDDASTLEWLRTYDWFAELRDDDPAGPADHGLAEPADDQRPPAGDRRRAACQLARRIRRGQRPRRYARNHAAPQPATPGARGHAARAQPAAGHDRRPAAAAGRVVRDGFLYRAPRRSGGARRSRHPRPRDLSGLARRCPRPPGLPPMPADQHRLPGLPPGCPVGPGQRHHLGRPDDRRHALPPRRQQPALAGGRGDPGRPGRGHLQPSRTQGGTGNTQASTTHASQPPRSARTRHRHPTAPPRNSHRPAGQRENPGGNVIIPTALAYFASRGSAVRAG